MTSVGQVSKRFILNFDPEHAERNIDFFVNTLKCKNPIVIIGWSTYEETPKVWAYATGENGLKPWDVSEGHWRSFMDTKPGRGLATELTAEEFLAKRKEVPGRWYDSFKEPFGKLVWEPFDKKRGVSDETHVYDGYYKLRTKS